MDKETGFIDRPGGMRIAFRHTPGRAPGILFCPGFNSDMGGTKAVALDSWCREQGRQFTRFDYFGHGESSGRFEDGSIGRWRDDALQVLDEVTQDPQLIVGSSMGGWIAMLVALARPQRIQALLGIAPAPDFTERMREQRLDAAQLRDLAETGYCEIPNTYDDGEPHRISQYMLEEGSKHLLLGREIAIDVPVRLLHGQGDEDVPWQLSLALADTLRSRDVEVQLVKSGDHRLSEPRDLRRMLAVIEELLGR